VNIAPSHPASLKSYHRLLRSVVLLIAAMLVCSSGGCAWMSSGQNSQGVRLFEQGNFDAAAQNFRKAIQTDPKNPDGYYNLAAYYHRQGKTQQRPVDLAQAESYYRQCLDYNPNHFDCRRGLAVLMVEEGRSEEAFKMLEDWSTQNPMMAEPKIELARLFEEFGDKEAAKQHLTSALSVAPNDPRALAALGKLREESGDFGQALSNYQRSLAAYRFQPQLAERVAALQSAGINSSTVAAGGTQVVTTVR
jgi:tetratricopeptide (TPR) repeat protein